MTLLWNLLSFKTFYTNKKPKSDSRSGSRSVILKYVYVCEKCSGHCVVLLLTCSSMREAREYSAVNLCKTLPSHGCSPTVNNNQQQVTGHTLVWSVLYLGNVSFIVNVMPTCICNTKYSHSNFMYSAPLLSPDLFIGYTMGILQWPPELHLCCFIFFRIMCYDKPLSVISF
jgi:hypothetical protein